MLFSKTLKLLMCFVMIFPYLLYGVDQASAASNYNHAELMDYEGYGEAMYNSLVEETTFITGEYTDNKEYVNKSIGEIKDYAKFWWEENKVEGEGVGAKLKDVFVKGAAYTLTVGDWVKKFFNDYDVAKPDTGGVDYSPYEVALQMVEGSKTDMEVKSGYVVNVYYGSKMMSADGTRKIYPTMSFNFRGDSSDYTYTAYVGTGFLPTDKTYSGSEEELQKAIDSFTARQNGTVSGLVSLFYSFGYRLEVVQSGSPIVTDPISKPTPAREKLVKYINDEMATKPIRTPEPKPSLTCPNGEKINLTIDGSTFLNTDGSVMLVSKDGTATVNGTSCALQWQTPEMGYVDDKAAMTDPQGNWLDMITGDILECVVTGDCKPSVPGEDEEVEELDNALIEYIKNAYEYATGVLKTATDGLKSLATGAKDLTALFGTFFSWLPKEMVVLMSSGLGIAIGLRLFRK